MSNFSLNLILAMFSLSLLLPSQLVSAQPVLQLGGKNYEASALPVSIQQALADAEQEHYQRQRALIEEAAILMHLEEQAAKQKKSLDEIKEQLLAVGEPSDEQLRKFYDENQHRIPFPFDQIKGELIQIVSAQNVAEKRQELVDQLHKRHNLKVVLTKPEIPRITINADGFHTRGNERAKLHIVEFADYQCPHCRHAADAWKEIWKSYQGKVKLTFVDFPINPSGISRHIAEAAYCAGKQGKYWEFHYLAFDNQPQLTRNSPSEFAKELKLEDKPFQACLGSDEAKDFVARSKSEGERLGVSGTPTFYFNGRRMAVGHDAKSLKNAIDEALKTTSS